MINQQQKFYSIVSILITIIMISCSHSRYNLTGFNEDSEYPPGVDSLVTAKSDSIIKFLFVDFTKEQKADNFTNIAQVALNQADSIWQKLQKNAKDSTQLFRNLGTDGNLKTSPELNNLVEEIRDNLQIAEKNFQRSIQLNPFSLNSKDGLAQTYILWAEIEKRDIYNEKAVTILENLVKHEQGEHIIFYKLADCYFHLEKWAQALRNYRQAGSVFLATITLHKNSSDLDYLVKKTVDNEIYFSYLYSQAVCLARMYRAKEALSVIKQAIAAAPSIEKRKIAERFEDWLNWDNGNIQAAEQKSQILQLIDAGKYSEAVSSFEILKNQLSDQFAIDEIQWRIAGLEFKFLNKKKQACNRLLSIIKKNERVPYYPPSLIDTYNKYVTDCGVMHFHLGMDHIQRSEYKAAKKYLEQGTEIDWYGNYKCQLELAKLNKHDPNISLEIIEQVLQVQSELTVSEKLAALEIKLSALKKLGPKHFEESQKIYHQIRELQRK